MLTLWRLLNTPLCRDWRAVGLLGGLIALAVVLLAWWPWKRTTKAFTVGEEHEVAAWLQLTTSQNGTHSLFIRLVPRGRTTPLDTVEATLASVDLDDEGHAVGVTVYWKGRRT